MASMYSKACILRVLDQGGFNQRHELTLFLPLNRLRPYVGGSYVDVLDPARL